MRAPPGVQILSISCSFWENLAKSYVGAPTGELAPPPWGNPRSATEDNGSMWCCMCSLVEILCVLEEEIGLVCWQLLHDMLATEIFGIQPTCELSLFSFWVNLLDISSICYKLRAFARNLSLWKSYLMPWRPKL